MIGPFESAWTSDTVPGRSKQSPVVLEQRFVGLFHAAARFFAVTPPFCHPAAASLNFGLTPLFLTNDLEVLTR